MKKYLCSLFIVCFFCSSQAQVTNTITLVRSEELKISTSFISVYQQKANLDAQKLKDKGETMEQAAHHLLINLGYSAEATAEALKTIFLASAATSLAVLLSNGVSVLVTMNVLKDVFLLSLEPAVTLLAAA